MNFQTALLLLVSFVFSIMGGFIALNGKTIEERNLGIGCLGLLDCPFYIYLFCMEKKSIRKANQSKCKLCLNRRRKKVSNRQKQILRNGDYPLLPRGFLSFCKNQFTIYDPNSFCWAHWILTIFWSIIWIYRQGIFNLRI